MNQKRLETNRTRTVTLFLLSALLALAPLLSACQAPTSMAASASTATLPEPAKATATLTATVAAQPTVTPTRAAPTQIAAPTLTPASNAGQSAVQVTVDASGVAQDLSLEVVPAVPPSADAPWWAAMPEYTLLTLHGYPIADHLLQPQIFVYPVQELGVNETAAQVAEGLQTLLQNQQVGESLPYLPLYNARQVIHPQIKYLDFRNGQGVRFLTWYSQGIVPINNHELHYTYQGLTSDGQYYVAAVLPVNLPGLPADERATDPLPPDLSNDYPKYVADTADMLNQQPADAFTPDLSKLDAMMQSIEVR
jgi:hypothetical protein